MYGKRRHFAYITQTYNNFRLQGSISEVFQKYDIFGLGIELFNLYKEALENGNVRYKEWCEKNLLPILRGCCDFNIKSRFTPRQAKLRLQNVFKIK